MKYNKYMCKDSTHAAYEEFFRTLGLSRMDYRMSSRFRVQPIQDILDNTNNNAIQ